MRKNKLHSIDKPYFRYRNAWYMAFYSRRLYVDVCKRWRGIGLTYLLLLITLLSIPLSLRLVIDFNRYFDEQMMDPIRQLPNIYIQNGQLSLDAPMPYLIRNKQGEVVAVVDGKSTYPDMIKFYPKLTLLITDRIIYFSPPKLALFRAKKVGASDNHPYESPITDLRDGLFNGDDWIQSSGVIKMKWFVEALVFPSVAAFFFAIYMVFMLAVTLLAQAYSWMIFKIKLKFREAARLCMIAVTAPVVLLFALLTMHTTIPGSGTVQILLFAAYFSFAALAVKHERKSLVRG